jgi:regulator of protease activity HflC (stomatin/prohibitin superfamily)
VEPLIVVAVIIVLVLLILARSVRIVPQARAGIVERLGRYQRTLNAGLTILIPFVDRLKPLIDLREQVVSFPPQPVITSDNLVVSIDTVIYFQVTDPRSATYEIANYIQGVEQLTVTTLRNVVGSMDLERTLTSREEINTALRGVLDEATGKWGIRVNRVELKAIEPPVSIRDSMEKQMRADRDKRAAVLNAEGVKQSQILTAEGERQSTVLRAQGDKEAVALRAEGERQAAILKAQGEAQAIETVFASIHAGDPDPKLLSYQYLQILPRIAEGNANKLWIVPSEVTRALDSVQGFLSGTGPDSGTETSAANGPAGPRQVTSGADGAAAQPHTAALGPVPLDSPVPPAQHSELLDEAERIARQTEEEAAKVVRDAEPAPGLPPRDPNAG